MLRFFQGSAIAAALIFASAPAIAGEAAVSAAASADATPVKLVAFDGGWEVLKTSQQLRVWRSHLEYAIAVDAAGKPTDCELTDKFRRAYVNQKLCSVLMKSHTFEPARDAANAPVAGRFINRLSYKDLREKH